MGTPKIIAITVLLGSLLLIWVLVRARTLGPLVMVGVILGAAAGISATALFAGLG